jgi:hypothetical protein
LENAVTKVCPKIDKNTANTLVVQSVEKNLDILNAKHIDISRAHKLTRAKAVAGDMRST